MLELEDALSQILSHVHPLDVQSAPVPNAVGRYLARPFLAPLDLPPFDNSAMDGYAVRAEDLPNASPQSPVILTVKGRLPAGDSPSCPVDPGTCVRIFTGSPMPPGADAVVMQEDIQPLPRSPQIRVLAPVTPWENVRFKGEDVRNGTLLLRPGQRVTPATIGLLSALGTQCIDVRRQPIIGLIATGNELKSPGQTLEPGQIFESNRVTLASHLVQAGAVPKILPLIPDSLQITEATLRQAFTETDAVITTGGVSVGELDYVKQAFTNIGGSTEFWKVAIKPGKPFVFGKWNSKLLFGLPGNPVSAIVTFLMLVRPALLKWQGAEHLAPVTHPARLRETLTNSGNRRHFVRVRFCDDGSVERTGPQASHILSSLAQAEALVDVPPEGSLPKNSTVQVIRMDC